MVLFTGACSQIAGIFSQTSEHSAVAVIDGVKITSEELLLKYERTASGAVAAKYDSAAVTDFLERYVNLRIKLLAAREAGYYGSVSLKEELDGYRNSLGRPYLLDKEVMEPIVRDLFEKKQEVLSVSHILIRVEPDATPLDTVRAYDKLAVIRDSVVAGANFGAMALRYSEDPSASISELAPGYKGFLGKLRAGRLVEPFEDMAYHMPVGEVSPIFRTRFGYHILTVHDRLPMQPDIRLSHIMIRANPEEAQDSLSSLERILAIKARIDAGEPFDSLARSTSEDASSAAHGGDIGTFSYDASAVDTAFINAAFALEHIGDISGVVESTFGYHLIKLTERSSWTSYEEAFDDLKRTVSRMPRVRRAEKELAGDLRSSHRLSVDTLVLQSLVEGVPRDSVRRILSRRAVADSAGVVVVGTYADSSFTVGQLSSFINESSTPLPAATTADQQILIYMDAFLDDTAISYAARQLEDTDEEFGEMMREFEDGLVLFRFMEDSVWTAAETDSVALAAHYVDHKNNYRFPDRKLIVQLYSRNDSLLTDAVSRLDSGATWTTLALEFAADSTHAMEIDTVMVEGATNSIYDRALDLQEGSRTDPIAYRSGKAILYYSGTEPARTKTFPEARASVLSEYQEMIEDWMIARLRARYAVQTYPEHLQSAFRME